ncbi:UNVERIFIED_CONTAM: hypothetical protein Sangu_1057100 [Sesamum angustifolium]|uniref:Uncharacterized protein n=1 Tax=Sesamum angustifolium TaxID=2727405 RepID=A0AAW2NZR0_9LAMI
MAAEGRKARSRGRTARRRPRRGTTTGIIRTFAGSWRWRRSGKRSSRRRREQSATAAAAEEGSGGTRRLRGWRWRSWSSTRRRWKN